MTSRDELLRLVERLEAHAAVEADSPYCNHHVEHLCSEAAAAIRELLEQEPVAWERKWSRDGKNEKGQPGWSLLAMTKAKLLPNDEPLYALPVAAPAQSFGLPIDLNHEPADLAEAKEMLRRARALTFTSLDGLHKAIDAATETALWSRDQHEQ
jgi:hypothetical protein